MLPRAGGIFDQDERMMGLLDVVTEEVARWKQKKELEQRIEMDNESRLRGLPSARH